MSGLIFYFDKPYCRKCNKVISHYDMMGKPVYDNAGAVHLTNMSGDTIGFRCSCCGKEWRII